MKKGLLILIAGTLSVLCLGKNMLPNSSFELGSAGWGIRTVVPKLDGKYRAIREKISSGQAVHGLSLLELSNPKGHTVQVCSIGIPVKPGKHTFSIWLKGDRDFPCRTPDLQLNKRKLDLSREKSCRLAGVETPCPDGEDPG